ncbi:hypothetical protein MA16_Dca026275 [Dendrobium catenatum]|uniref:Uncharacterized protein n=1 Tax=Dendrobium catenatum TaxID=906689 RepID=A0A2I0VD34_9ASPA|nr:hypothetical protein MA16_Dca026275 [Dendrobium catenatum]
MDPKKALPRERRQDIRGISIVFRCKGLQCFSFRRSTQVSKPKFSSMDSSCNEHRLNSSIVGSFNVMMQRIPNSNTIGRV